MIIRRPLEADIPQIVEMGRRFHAESIYSEMIGFNPEAFASSLAIFIASETMIFFVMEREEEIIGAICGAIGPHYMTGELASSELFWWVTPEARGRGLKLLDAFEREAVARGARIGGMVAPRGSEQLARVYAHKGYAISETVFVRALACT